MSNGRNPSTTDTVSIQLNAAVARLALSIADQPGNAGRTFNQLKESDQREFTNFAYSEMTDFERIGWFSDSLCGRELTLLEILRDYHIRDVDLLTVGFIVASAHLNSVASIYDNIIHGPQDIEPRPPRIRAQAG